MSKSNAKIFVVSAAERTTPSMLDVQYGGKVNLSPTMAATLKQLGDAGQLHRLFRNFPRDAAEPEPGETIVTANGHRQIVHTVPTDISIESEARIHARSTQSTKPVDGQPTKRRGKQHLSAHAPGDPYTADEVADKIHKSRKTVSRLEQRGFIKRVSGTSRPPLYTANSVDAWLSGRHHF